MGIWKTCFNERNTQTFDRIFTGFRNACPWDDHIAELYPDITRVRAC